MGDTLIKYTGAVDCSAIGGQNPAAVKMAQVMMSGPELQASVAMDVNSQSVASFIQASQGRSF